MKAKQAIATAAVSFGLCLGGSAVFFPQPTLAFQYYPDYGRLRGRVDKTQSDLRDALALEPEGGKGHDRYREAQKSLSDFDKHLAKAHFDKGELDHCIDHLKSVLDHNTLQASSRDALMHDIDELRIARDRNSH
jgi:tetratricopeptide (TPR) repeat protein